MQGQSWENQPRSTPSLRGNDETGQSDQRDEGSSQNHLSETTNDAAVHPEADPATTVDPPPEIISEATTEAKEDSEGNSSYQPVPEGLKTVPSKLHRKGETDYQWTTQGQRWVKPPLSLRRRCKRLKPALHSVCGRTLTQGLPLLYLETVQWYRTSKANLLKTPVGSPLSNSGNKSAIWTSPSIPINSPSPRASGLP